MGPKIYINIKSALLLTTLGLLGLCSCETPDEQLDFNAEALYQSELIPNEMWIDEAFICIEQAKNYPTNYTLYSSIPDFENELRVFFDTQKKVYKTEVFSAKKKICDLFFESNRVVYSLHKDTTSGLNWLVAYANEKPYAAALQNETEWEAVGPKDLAMKFDFVYASMAKSKKIVTREFNGLYSRLAIDDKSISGTIAPISSQNYVLNVSKGTPLELALESERSNVFFTLGPKDGVNMEIQHWKGIISESGDLTISVFTLEADTNQNYTLTFGQL